ncbi:hypothetical protein [Streptomyces sp. NBC_01013]|uniref:hypothetical protein n=1 Tax=Streptomyces sp. NBC_01013 TaxID=2903718 RepID=UPI00386CAD6A|nr:hypothetical protein OG538_05090 [Streptomyces sp. NBC_01013]
MPMENATKLETAATAEPADKATTDFTLSASESELLEEFGVLLAAEYNYVAAI